LTALSFNVSIRPQAIPRYIRSLHLIALLTGAATFPLTSLGGLVTLHQAGSSVPDWPNSWGYYRNCEDIMVSTNTVNELRQLLDAERAARAQVERESRLKDEVLLLVSHELRTPLSAVLGWSQLLQHQELHAHVTEGLQAIEHNARAQIRIIDDLLDAGRLMSGNISLDLHPVAIASVLDAAIDTMRPTAIAKRIRLERQYEPTVAPVLADPHRLEQVFRNLVANAIKFTPDGGSVNVLLNQVGAMAQATVVDTGRGIDPKAVENVFDRFWQDDEAHIRRDGLGLGLWIVKQIVEQHGGTVHAESNGSGTGAAFRVLVPILLSALACCGSVSLK
jgi:signal transduction histidine kinase